MEPRKLRSSVTAPQADKASSSSSTTAPSPSKSFTDAEGYPCRRTTNEVFIRFKTERPSRWRSGSRPIQVGDALVVGGRLEYTITEVEGKKYGTELTTCTMSLSELAYSYTHGFQCPCCSKSYNNVKGHVPTCPKNQHRDIEKNELRKARVRNNSKALYDLRKNAEVWTEDHAAHIKMLIYQRARYLLTTSSQSDGSEE